MHGKGIAEDDKAISETVPMTDSTVRIVQKRKPDHLQIIVDEINKFKIGSGLADA